MTEPNWKPFIVNVEGPDDIEEFGTMREAAERANEINASLVDTVSRGGEFAPHLWAVPWRTGTFLERFKQIEAEREERARAFDDAVAVNNREVARRVKAQEERDAALAVIEQVREWQRAFRREYRYEPLVGILTQSPASALAKVKAAAFREAAQDVDGDDGMLALSVHGLRDALLRRAERIEQEADRG